MGAIAVAGIGKAYRRYPGRWARLAEWLLGGERHEKHWVLSEVDFAIHPGEAVGIVGLNGAGKSTLLKIITGTVRPTTGSVRTEGRIAALLELGMGFHPDFTGRQNVFMAGQLQGLGAGELAELMPQIEAFAEIGDYMDQPVRVYSSGMQVRLAFSVATVRRPDLLIVDEALSVGDAYFQHKSFDRLKTFREQGTTLLVVSHDLAAIKTLCTRVLLLSRGRVVADGAPAETLETYNALIAPEAGASIKEVAGEGLRSGDGRVRVGRVELRDLHAPCQALLAGSPAVLRIEFTAHADVADLTIGFLIRDRLGNDIFGSNTHHLAVPLAPLAAGRRFVIEFAFPSMALGPGHYSVTVAAHASRDHLAGSYDWWDRALVFQVIQSGAIHTVGVCHMPMTCSVREDLQ